MEVLDIEGKAISIRLASGVIIQFSDIGAWQIKKLALFLGRSNSYIEAILTLRSCSYSDVLYIPIHIYSVVSCEAGHFALKATCGDSCTVTIKGSYFGVRCIGRRRKTWATKTTLYSQIECHNSAAAD